MLLALRLSVFVAFAASILSVAEAFSDTAPLVAFSSHKTPFLEEAWTSSAPAVSIHQVVQHLTRRPKELCAVDAVGLVEVDGVSMICAFFISN